MLETKRLDNLLHRWDKLVRCLVDLLSPLEIRSVWSIEHEQREKRTSHECGTPEEQRP